MGVIWIHCGQPASHYIYLYLIDIIIPRSSYGCSEWIEIYIVYFIRTQCTLVVHFFLNMQYILWNYIFMQQMPTFSHITWNCSIQRCNPIYRSFVTNKYESTDRCEVPYININVCCIKIRLNDDCSTLFDLICINCFNS